MGIWKKHTNEFELNKMASESTKITIMVIK